MGKGPRPAQAGTVVVNGNLIVNGGTVIINGGTLVVNRPAGASKGAALQGRRVGKPVGRAAVPPMFNPRVLFQRLDTNKDGKLSFDEFTVGVRHLQRFLATRFGELKRPLSDGVRAVRAKMGQFRGQSGRPGMGPMGQHPGKGLGMGPMGQHPGKGLGMGPMGQHPGMGPMGQHPGMGPMGPHPGMGFGMGPMGPHPGMGPMGMAGAGMFGGHRGPPDGKVRVWVSSTGFDGGKSGMRKPAAVACPKCGAKTPAACTCGKKHQVKKCEVKKHEAKKCEAKKPAAGHRSIEARLTALETQQAEILRLLRSATKPEHRGGGERGFHHGER